MIRKKWLIFFIGCILSGCNAFGDGGDSKFNPDIIIGRWQRDRNPRTIVDIRKKEDHYEVYNVSADDKYFSLNEVVGIFSYFPDKGFYVGEHKWGGDTINAVHWSTSDAMQIKIKNKNEITKVYLDSVYKGGWIYKRVP